MLFAFEGAIKGRAKEVRECGQTAEKSQGVSKTDDEKTGKSVNGNEKGGNDVKVHSLAVMLLVEFLESLEKAMFNASDGCAVAVPPPNKVGPSSSWYILCYGVLQL